LYQYSIQYFFEIFNNVLTSNANLKGVKDPQQRLKIIAKDLFYLAYYRLARGMLNDDRLVLALLLSKIYLKGFVTSNDSQTLVDSFYHSLMTSSFNLMHNTTIGYVDHSRKRNVESFEQIEILLQFGERNIQSKHSVQTMVGLVKS
jgi:hypothetical protein